MRRFALPLTVAAAALLAANLGYADYLSRDTKNIHNDNRQLHRENRDIRHDKRNMAGDKHDLRQDRRERNRDQFMEDKAIQRGDLKDAQKWDQRRRQEQHEVSQDKRDLAHDRSDLRHDRNARNDTLHDRKRDMQDAGGTTTQ